MAAYQVCFMVLVALLALITIIMLVVNGGFNSDTQCPHNNYTLGEYEVNMNNSSSSVVLHSRIGVLENLLRKSNESQKNLARQLQLLKSNTSDLTKHGVHECIQNTTGCDMVIRSACERDIVVATEQQQRRIQSLRSELVQIQHQLKDQQNVSSNLTQALTHLKTCFNRTQLLEKEKVALQTSMVEQRTTMDLCSNTSIQLHDATQTLETQIEEARFHLTNCSNNISQLYEKHSNLTQILQQLNLTLKSCSNNTAVLQKELESEKSTHLQLKTTCTNNTKTLSASVIKFIERCQERVRNISLTRLTSGHYLFSTSQVNWFAAVKRCHSHGLQLASVESAQENEALVKEARRITKNEGNHRFWLSGSDLGSEGSFEWISTGSVVTYTAWHVSEPNNAWGGEHCMQLWNRRGYYGWNDSSCSSLAGYICEVPFVCRT